MENNNLVVNMVMKMEASIYKKGIMRTNLDQEIREGPNRSR